MRSVLITGGTGYIGSQCCVALIEAGYRPVIIDNLANSHPAVVDAVALLTGVRPAFVVGDIRDGALVEAVLREHDVGSVIHFAALKAVGDSVAEPLAYFDVNVGGSIALLSAMRRAGVRTLVFSSSAAVYGDAARVPIAEDAPCVPASPYGRSKLMVEEMLEDLARSEPGWSIARLRYFNPVGAHASGLLGEDPRGTPSGLMPLIGEVAAGRRARLAVYGGDYPTPDGTGLRDFIHVTDLVEGHLAALRRIEGGSDLLTVNLGTGQGHTVLEVVAAFAAVSGREIPYDIVARRPGDAAASYADPSLAREVLGWSARRPLDEMCADAWRWQCGNWKIA